MSDQALLSKTNVSHRELDELPRTNILNAADRCDSCSAAAYVRVNLQVSDTLPEGGLLQFCSHHYNKAELGLMPLVEGKPIDERWKLEQNRLVGNENS